MHISVEDIEMDNKKNKEKTISTQFFGSEFFGVQK